MNAMKSLRRWLTSLGAVACLLSAGPAAAQQAADADGDNVLESDEVSGYDEGLGDTDPETIPLFRPKLAPYGTWVDHPTYGTVWVPNSELVGPDFAPYVSNGRWELTNDGDWLWVSGYDWGYIPFHYGRWVWISQMGWSWIPGRVYAPAWVVWRVGPGGYLGWAPYPPAYYWSGGVALSLWFTPPAAYIFCPSAYAFHPHVHTHVVRTPAEVRRAVAQTSPYRGGRTSGYRPAQPTVSEAQVPRSSVPKARSAGDAKALALAPKGAVSAERPTIRATGDGRTPPARGGTVRPRSPSGDRAASGRPGTAPAGRDGDGVEPSPRASIEGGGRGRPAGRSPGFEGRSQREGATADTPQARKAAPSFRAVNPRPPSASAPRAPRPPSAQPFRSSAPRSAPPAPAAQPSRRRAAPPSAAPPSRPSAPSAPRGGGGRPSAPSGGRRGR